MDPDDPLSATEASITDFFPRLEGQPTPGDGTTGVLEMIEAARKAKSVAAVEAVEAAVDRAEQLKFPFHDS